MGHYFTEKPLKNPPVRLLRVCESDFVQIMPHMLFNFDHKKNKPDLVASLPKAISIAPSLRWWARERLEIVSGLLFGSMSMVSRLYAVSQECKVGTIIIPFTPAFYFSLLSLLTHSILMAKRKGKSAQPSCRSKRAR